MNTQDNNLPRQRGSTFLRVVLCKHRVDRGLFVEGGDMATTLTGTWELTTEHPTSSYGAPVLVNRATGDGYGPGDIVKCCPSWGFMPAADAVRRMAKTAELDDEGRDAIARFCRQCPDQGDDATRAREYLRLAVTTETGRDALRELGFGSIIDAPDKGDDASTVRIADAVAKRLCKTYRL